MYHLNKTKTKRKGGRVRRSLAAGGKTSKRFQSGPNRSTAKKRNFRTRIFIGGVPSHFKEDDLKEYFQEFGQVFSIKLKKKKKTSEVNLGFGTITVDNQTAERILVKNFHMIQNRKIECQRFVKNNKADNKLIIEKKLKTLYITEPPEKMGEDILRSFFGELGELENAYILPERKIASEDPEQEFEVLKRKALLLFRSVEDAKTILEASERQELIFEGQVITLHHKWPEDAELEKEEQAKDSSESHSKSNDESKSGNCLKTRAGLVSIVEDSVQLHEKNDKSMIPTLAQEASDEAKDTAKISNIVNSMTEIKSLQTSQQDLDKFEEAHISSQPIFRSQIINGKEEGHDKVPATKSSKKLKTYRNNHLDKKDSSASIKKGQAQKQRESIKNRRKNPRN